MKKIITILAVVAILLGLVLFVAKLVVNGFDFTALFGGKLETHTTELSGEFTDITISVSTASVKLAPSEDGTCRVVCAEPEKLRHVAEVRDGTLEVRVEDSRSWFDRIGIQLKQPELTLYLPAADYGTLRITTDTGSVSLPEGLRFRNAYLQSDTGSLELLSAVSDHVRLASDTGSLRLRGLSPVSVELSTHTGRVETEDVQAEGRVTVTVSTGRVSLTDLNCEFLDLSASTGDLSLKNVLVSGTMTAETSTGDVRLERCDAGALYIETSTGDVSGSLRTAKQFSVKTSTGTVRVPDSAPGGPCEITTSTGNVELEIR
ncbi:MAG: DUF4097 family beta strand repeat protein [Oscillospiraceae bacterium]|nr:DUF4097 family beta strand repeat protein [Oscillospiraceae bacterium]